MQNLGSGPMVRISICSYFCCHNWKKERFMALIASNAIVSVAVFISALMWTLTASGAGSVSHPESPQDFRSRQMKSGPAYRYVFSSKGITCDIGEHLESTRPTLSSDGHFSCPCVTDMGCAMVNPHIDESSGDIDPKILAGAPKGSHCGNAVSWTEASKNVGRTLVLVGPVANVMTAADAKGRPTLISVGNQFPNPNRLTLVVWKNSFEFKNPREMMGKFVCVVGKISNYQGSPQIVLRSADELRVSK
jgi:hypothetical protein